MQYEGKIYGKVAGKYIELKPDNALQEQNKALHDLLGEILIGYEEGFKHAYESHIAFFGTKPDLDSEQWQGPKWLEKAYSLYHKLEK